jgi:hypothetical protein
MDIAKFFSGFMELASLTYFNLSLGKYLEAF